MPSSDGLYDYEFTTIAVSECGLNPKIYPDKLVFDATYAGTSHLMGTGERVGTVTESLPCAARVAPLVHLGSAALIITAAVALTGGTPYGSDANLNKALGGVTLAVGILVFIGECFYQRYAMNTAETTARRDFRVKVRRLVDGKTGSAAAMLPPLPPPPPPPPPSGLFASPVPAPGPGRVGRPSRRAAPDGNPFLDGDGGARYAP